MVRSSSSATGVHPPPCHAAVLGHRHLPVSQVVLRSAPTDPRRQSTWPPSSESVRADAGRAQFVAHHAPLPAEVVWAPQPAAVDRKITTFHLATSPRKRPGCPSGLDAAGSGNGPVSPLSQPFPAPFRSPPLWRPVRAGSGWESGELVDHAVSSVSCGSSGGPVAAGPGKHGHAGTCSTWPVTTRRARWPVVPVRRAWTSTAVLALLAAIDGTGGLLGARRQGCGPDHSGASGRRCVPPSRCAT